MATGRNVTVSSGPCLDDGECGAACMEETGERAKHWTYVGPGQGNYEKVEKYMPVTGGAYSITEVPTRRISPACCCWCLCLLFLTLILLVGFLLRDRLISLPSLIAKDMTVSHDVLYTPPLHDCSVGTWSTNLRGDVQAALQAYRNQAFKETDTNLDGLLSHEELSAPSSKLPKCFAERHFEWDQDGNGLTLGELEGGLASQATIKSHHMLMEPEKMNAVADLDCDGYISVAELAALNKSPLPQHTKDLFIGGDVDADGKLESVEMVAALQKSMLATNPAASKSAALEVWDEKKRLWCCETDQLGCSTLAFDTPEPESCEEGSVVMWSESKSARCCSTVGIGCPDRPDTYDCVITSGNHPEDWSGTKRERCCKHVGIGCRPEDAEPYSCIEGITRWQTGWSDAKKSWCCEHKQLGCEDAGHYECGSDEATWSVGQRHYCCTTHHKGCDPSTIPKPKFNCREGWPHDVDSWTGDKKEFCCSNYARGCKVPPKPHPHPHPHPYPVDPVYNCQDGLAQWRTLWGASKRAWCCTHKDLGCQHHGDFDCNVGSTDKWPSAKEDYCCLYQKKGCHFNVHGKNYVYSDDTYHVHHHWPHGYATTGGHSIVYPGSATDHYSYSDTDGSYPGVDTGYTYGHTVDAAELQHADVSTGHILGGHVHHVHVVDDGPKNEPASEHHTHVEHVVADAAAHAAHSKKLVLHGGEHLHTAASEMHHKAVSEVHHEAASEQHHKAASEQHHKAASEEHHTVHHTVHTVMFGGDSGKAASQD